MQPESSKIIPIQGVTPFQKPDRDNYNRTGETERHYNSSENRIKLLGLIKSNLSNKK